MRTAGMISTLLLILAVAVAVAEAAAPGADPAAAVRDLDDGCLGLSYPAREGVEGNADHFQLHLGNNQHTYSTGRWTDDAETWTGDVHALLRIRDGRVLDVDFTVLRPGDARPRADRDLGTIAAADASAFFLEVALTAKGEPAQNALLGAVVARGACPARELGELVRDRKRPGEVRESALFWMAVLAGEEAFGTVRRLIDDEDEDMNLREHAVFALTQLDEDRAFPLLMDVATNHPNGELRRGAFIWLAQYDRPEVVNLFEEILVTQ